MQFKTISDIENPLFNRREIEGEIHTEVVPSRGEVRKILAEKFSVGDDTIKIRTIKGKFGSKVFLIVANIYKSKEDKEKVEHRKKKDFELEKKQAEAQQKESEKKEETNENPNSSTPENADKKQTTQEVSTLTNQKNTESLGEANSNQNDKKEVSEETENKLKEIKNGEQKN